MSVLNYIRFLARHRNIAKIISRGMCLWKRYGLNTDKMQKYLGIYQELLARYDVIPTFFITGDVLEKHTQLVQTHVSRKVDLGIHGYRHIDLTKIPFRNQKQQIERAIRAFQRASIKFSGFRAPYLSWNSHILDALDECNISWDSSQSILWNVIDKKNTNKEWSWLRTLSLYNYRNASNHISVPHLRGSLVEIPVSLPDDDMLIDRLTTNTATGKIWNKILDETYEKGELFTLQLHPERIVFCKDALESLLKRSLKHYRLPIWIAPLSEISSWWREKGKFHFKITENRENYYHIEAICSERALVLVKNAKVKYDRDFFNGYKIMKGNHFTIESSTRPVIGVSTNASANLIKFLKNEGFLFEISDKKEQYGIYFEDDMNIQENERKILCLIEQSQFPIIRFWRWPNGCKSVLSVTGDIDALTSTDFFLRLFES